MAPTTDNEHSGANDCYASVREQDIQCDLDDAISQLAAAWSKEDDAPMSSYMHFLTAVVRIVSCLPGWTPNGQQRELVDHACECLRMLVPERFDA